MLINDEELLQRVLAHPDYIDFNHQAEPGIYRPRKKGSNTSPEQLSVKGYYNHQTGEVKPLKKIADDLGLLPKKTREYKQKSPTEIYGESDFDIGIIRAYFNGRGIDITDDVINQAGIRTWKNYKNNDVIVVPMRNTLDDLIQITRIELDGNFRKISKKFTGSATEDRGLLLRRDESRLAVFEGIEDGLTYYFNAPTTESVLICFGTGGFSRISSFTDQFEKVGVFLDNDKNDQSLKASSKLPQNVITLIPTTEPGLDANSALQADRFDEWFKSTKKVSDLYDDSLQLDHEAAEDIGYKYPNQDVIDYMNSIHFGVLVGNSYRYGYKQKLQNSEKYELRLLKKPDLEAMYTEKLVEVGVDKQGNPKYKTYADFWLGHKNRLKYDRLVLKPTSKVLPGEFNIWQGFDIDPKKYESANPNNCKEFLDFILEVICSGSEQLFSFVLDWCADCVQYPEDKQGVALVLKSEQEGTGKTFFSDRFGELWGPHYMSAAKKEMVTGRFSGHLENNIVLVAEEAVYANDPTAKNVLKDMVTSGKRNVERKGIDAEINKPNLSHIIFISNEDHVISASSTDRRFQVIEVSTCKQQDRQYFESLKKKWYDGERESFLKFLMQRDVSGIDLAKNRVMTEETAKQMELSLPSEKKWIKGFLMDGFFEATFFDSGQDKEVTRVFELWESSEVVSDYLYTDYINFCRVKKVKYPKVKSELTMILKKLFGEFPTKRQRLFGARRTVWCLPEYEKMIEIWNNKHGVKIRLPNNV